MSDFKAKMHQIRSPYPPSWIEGGLLLRGKKGKEGRKAKGEGGKKKRKKEEGMKTPSDRSGYGSDISGHH